MFANDHYFYKINVKKCNRTEVCIKILTQSILIADDSHSDIQESNFTKNFENEIHKLQTVCFKKHFYLLTLTQRTIFVSKFLLPVISNISEASSDLNDCTNQWQTNIPHYAHINKIDSIYSGIKDSIAVDENSLSYAFVEPSGNQIICVRMDMNSKKFLKSHIDVSQNNNIFKKSMTSFMHNFNISGASEGDELQKVSQFK